MIYFPPAKINLGLKVLDRREDGFHNIESIFVPTQLCDILEVHKLKNEAEGELKFECSGLEVDGSIQNNTIVKAHQLLSNKFNLPAIEAKLHKVIPTGAGLGGGSSDGTFMLKAINEICELGLSEDSLEKYAEELGSDCPFFVKNRTSYVNGRGEKLTPISEAVDGLGLKHMMILIIHPNVHINTSEAFTWIKDKGVTEGHLSQSDSSNIDLTSQYIHDLIGTPIENWREILVNDFEIPVTSRFSPIQKALQLIKDSGADYIQMTGSGSSVYGLFKLESTNNSLKDTKRVLKVQKAAKKASNEGFFVHFGALA